MTGAAPAPSRPPDPDAVAAAILACPGIADLSGGPFGAIATYLPGRRVHGVRILDDELDIHVVLAGTSTVLDAAAQVRAALAPLRSGRRVDVRFEDVAFLDDPPPPPTINGTD